MNIKWENLIILLTLFERCSVDVEEFLNKIYKFLLLLSVSCRFELMSNENYGNYTKFCYYLNMWKRNKMRLVHVEYYPRFTFLVKRKWEFIEFEMEIATMSREYVDIKHFFSRFNDIPLVSCVTLSMEKMVFNFNTRLSRLCKLNHDPNLFHLWISL